MLRCTRRRSAGERERTVITESIVDAQTITTWLAEAEEQIRAQSDYLTQLDAAIGDGDHGTNMRRGFDAVGKALAGQGDDTPPGRLLIVAGKTLVSTVGGASGPLWGSALRRAGRALGDAETFDGEQLALALDAAIEGVVELGAAAPGDKTMVDALVPAARGAARGARRGAARRGCWRRPPTRPQAGAEATVPMRRARAVRRTSASARSAIRIPARRRRRSSSPRSSRAVARDPGLSGGRAGPARHARVAGRRARRRVACRIGDASTAGRARGARAIATRERDSGAGRARRGGPRRCRRSPLEPPPRRREIVETGALMGQDPALSGASRSAIGRRSACAGEAILAPPRSTPTRSRRSPTRLLAARADDVRSLGRARRRAEHRRAAPSRRPGASVVLIAARPRPGGRGRAGAGARRRRAAGGGATAHAAIVARSLGIPMVTGLDARGARDRGRAPLVVDGGAGQR